MNIQYLNVDEGNFFTDNEEYDLYDYSDQINELENKSGIRILRGKDLSVIAFLEEEGKIIGVLYTEFSDGKYSFDVIVDEKFRGKGIGRELMDIGIREYQTLKNEFDNVELEVDAVNPKVVEYLKTKGLKIKKEIEGHIIMGESVSNIKENELIWELYSKK